VKSVLTGVTDLYQFGEDPEAIKKPDPDPDPYQREKSDPGPHQSKPPYPDPDSDADPQHFTALLQTCGFIDKIFSLTYL
jgi:hypothetical protein